MSNSGIANAPFSEWYDDEVPGERHSAVITALTTLRTAQTPRVNAGRLYDATYEQRNVFADQLSPMAGALGLGVRDEINLLTYNAMQIGFDTLVSKLTQADGAVKFQTDGADWMNRQKALQLEKLIKGEFYRDDFYEKKQEIELDMLLHGRGYLKDYIDHATKAPVFERVHPLDIFFDELEARDCAPRTMYQTRIVAKAVLKAMYPDYAEEINRAGLPADQDTSTVRALNPNEVCEVIEAWRLPSSTGAGDGKHIISLTTCVLEFGEWTRDDFPFATMTWTKRRRGPYAVSAAEQIIFQQRNLNRLKQREHECLYELSAPYILMDEASQVDPAQFETNGVGNMITHAAGSQPPQVVVNKVVPDDIRIAIEEMKRDIADTLGITGLESTGNKPQGLESAPAMQEYTEQSSLRHIKTLKENERFVLRAAKLRLETIREIKELYGDYVAFGQGRDEVEEIKFSSADLPPNAYRMQMALANLLPQTPAGRLQRAVQLSQTGAFTPKQVIRMFQSPDIDAITSDVTSGEEDIDWTIYHLTKPGAEYYPPDEHQDLELGITKVTAAYLRERRHKAPDEVLERLDRWIADALALQEAQQQAALAQMQAQQMAQAQQGAQQTFANQQDPMGGGSGVPPGESPAGA